MIETATSSEIRAILSADPASMHWNHPPSSDLQLREAVRSAYALGSQYYPINDQLHVRLPGNLYLSTPPSILLNQREPITRMAIDAARWGEMKKSDALLRLAFARGERSPETAVAIERMTSRVLESGISVFLHEKMDDLMWSEKAVLGDVASIRHFLEGQVMSNVTIMDLVDLLDIFSPLFPIEAVSITYDGIGPSGFTVKGVYDGVDDDELVFYITVDAEEGRAQIAFASVDVGDFSRMGFGTRSIVSLSTFLRRHGSGGWSDLINNDGLTVWPRMGAVVDNESMLLAAATLEMLDVLDVAKGFERVDARMGIEELSRIELNEGDVIDHNALREWFLYHAAIPEKNVGRLKPPYEVGIMALRSVGISAYFDAENVLRYMVRDYLPGRIARFEGRSVSSKWDRVTLLADIGLFTAFQRVREEIETIGSAEEAISVARMVTTTRENSFGGLLSVRDSAGEGGDSPIYSPNLGAVVPGIYSPEGFPSYGATGMQNAFQLTTTIAGLNMVPTIFIR